MVIFYLQDTHSAPKWLYYHKPCHGKFFGGKITAICFLVNPFLSAFYVTLYSRIAPLLSTEPPNTRVIIFWCGLLMSATYHICRMPLFDECHVSPLPSVFIRHTTYIAFPKCSIKHTWIIVKYSANGRITVPPSVPSVSLSRTTTPLSHLSQRSSEIHCRLKSQLRMVNIKKKNLRIVL